MSLSRLLVCIAPLFAAIIAVGCGPKPAVPTAKNRLKVDKQSAISSVALTQRSTRVSEQMFAELSATETGIDFVNELKPGNMKNYLLNGAGLCTGDYDQDGLVDVYLISQDGQNKLLRQVKPWQFEDVTDSAGGLGGGHYWGTGATFGDVDGDGSLDLYVCNINGPNLLFMNQGDGSFKEQGEAWNVDHSGATTMAAFADYDNDGDLDLYLLNNRILTLADETSRLKVRTVNGVPIEHPDLRDQYFVLDGRLQEAGQRDKLLRNDGGKFVDVTDKVGVAGYDMGLSATWWDFDDDGQIDIYVGNDRKSPDHFYRNLGTGKFTDILADSVGHTPWFSMGADSGDLNNDGMLDFLIADMSSTTHYKQKTTMGEMGNSAWFLTIGNPRQVMRNACYLNSGTTRFWEIANLAGLDSTDWTWSVKIADQDCDGKVDVFFTNGVGRNMNDSDAQKEFQRMMDAGDKEAAAAQILTMPPLKEKNLFFQNKGDLSFENVSDSWGADHFGCSNGCSVVDIDRDGDLDLLVSNLNEPLGVYRNGCQTGNRLLVKLNGTHSNRDGIHAKVLIETKAGLQIRQINLTRGYMSSDEPLAHFGLGDDDRIKKLTVKWPSGIRQEFDDLEVNRFYTITESGTPEKRQQPAPGQPMFEEIAANVGLNHTHSELDLDDFRLQPLLPNKLTSIGSGIAWADVNRDGRFDCYVGGAIGQTGKLFVQSGEGKFVEKSGPWDKKILVGEMGAVFLDFDSDGDQDLYVASGGYQQPPGDKTLQDSLYVNDGAGSFTVCDDGVLPDLAQSGSCACVCDFDRDGDLDLFVGTRLRPGEWPMPTDSYLLINDGGRFQVATADLAPALSNIGLVTSGLWSDADGDGWTDLLLTLEWGSIRFLKNEAGKLVDRTETAGLSENLGWWNSISGGDVDNDGDTDYIAMNFGLNTKYHADHAHPVTLYAKDFDGNGKFDLVESEWEGDKCFPIRGKSCSSHAMPVISEKFPTYHEFAMAELSDIYGSDSLESAQKFTANTLESVVLINDGSGHFADQDLPRLAQVSPGFGLAMEDFDGDGKCDVYIAQNFMNPQPETGRMDGGMGLLLRGHGDGTFQPAGPRETGIIVPEQGMGVAVVDLNADQIPDFTQTVNEGPLRAFLNRARSDWRRISLRIDGPPGNPTGVGARVQLKNSTSASRVAEVYAGSGYLSQSSGELFFAFDNENPYNAAEIRFADGTTLARKIDPDDKAIVIEPSDRTRHSDP